MVTQRSLAILLGIVLIGCAAVGLSVWDAKNGRDWYRSAPEAHGNGVPYREDRDTNPKPTFKTEGDRLTAEMDLAYCWFATFTNETTGLSHTLHNAYDETGKPCHH